ncbi:hypothetical protein Deba_1515 [Desulfarculus baarsii DSM 2075]|uniref:Lipoprotein n=2 Tax=Desulfarculus baarsii TaxID=453230 RepID=E1QH40_DESB2|nr:hypothetical protein Deba_1515 [Desulfarculus baarsii DSM 2075]
MKLGLAKLFFIVAIAAISLASTGCAYLKIQREARDPLRGPVMSIDAATEMPTVIDKRTWEEGTWEAPNYNVRIFAPEITSQLRADLAATKLFADLPSASVSNDESAPLSLKVVVNAFGIEEAGSNAYRVPQVLANGALLPVYAATNVATKGQVDMGGYVMPSTNIVTSLQADVFLIDKGQTLLIVKRSYQTRIKLGAVSQRELFEGGDGFGYYGVAVGKAQGAKAIADLADMIARDPSWKLVPEYRRIAMAQRVARQKNTLQAKADAAIELLSLVRPVTYTASEVKLLHDELFDDEVRANLFNQYRARILGFDDAEEMPASQRLTPEQVRRLLDDTSLFTDMAIDEMDRTILEFAASAMLPPLRSKTKQGPGARSAATAESADATRIRGQVADALVQKLKGDPLLQSMMLEIADKAIGRQWPAMKDMLVQLDSPAVKNYLTTRQ